MNKWMALIIGQVVILTGAVLGGQMSGNLGLLVGFISIMLALTVFVIFLRKHTALLAVAIGLPFILGIGLYLMLSDTPSEAERTGAVVNRQSTDDVPKDSPAENRRQD